MNIRQNLQSICHAKSEQKYIKAVSNINFIKIVINLCYMLALQTNQ